MSIRLTEDLYQGKRWRDRLDPVDEITDMEPFVPWFLACNPERFPYWYGRVEPRNRLLYRSIEKYLKVIEGGQAVDY